MQARQTASNDVTIDASHAFLEQTMRTTLALDDDLLASARAYTGIEEKSALVREALRALIERESARRLALLGGSEPELASVPRRQPACA